MKNGVKMMTRTPRPEVTPIPSEKHCLRCGKTAPAVKFRSPMAFKCMSCDEKTVEDRKEYHRRYHKARGRMIKRLLDKYPQLAERMMQEELLKVEREEGNGGDEDGDGEEDEGA